SGQTSRAGASDVVGDLDLQLTLLTKGTMNMARHLPYSLICALLLFGNGAFSLKGSPAGVLQVSLAGNTAKMIPEGAAFTITVRLKNTGTDPVAIPAPDALSQQTYLSLLATDATG